MRIGKVVPNPFSESAGEMKEWYHVKCIFEKLERARATTKKIEDITDLEGWEELQDADKEIINKHVSGTKATQNVNFIFLKCLLCRKIVLYCIFKPFYCSQAIFKPWPKENFTHYWNQIKLLCS